MPRLPLVIILAVIFISWTANAVQQTGSPASPAITGGGVTLTETDKTAVLSNGIVTATIGKASATVLSVNYKGHEFVSDSGRHKTIYFSRDGGKSFEGLSRCVFSVTARTPEMVDISC